MRDLSQRKPLPPPGGPYSLARIGPGGLVFVAGQTAVDPETKQLVGGGIAEQSRQVLENIAAILATEACGLGDVLKVSVFLADLGDFEAMNEIYRTMFPEPYPVRTTVQAGLAPGALIEVDVVAVAGGNRRSPGQPRQDPAAG